MGLSQDRRVRTERVDVIAIGVPAVYGARNMFGDAALRRLGDELGEEKVSRLRDMFTIETPAVSDDTHRGRLVALSQAVDGTFLRQLFASARAAGWTES